MIDPLSAKFVTISDVIRAPAVQDPQRRALSEDDRMRDYTTLDTMVH